MAATNSASEVEETLARIRSHKGVEGVIIMNREGETTKRSKSDDEGLVDDSTPREEGVVNALCALDDVIKPLTSSLLHIITD